jgi:hypothetical protein
VSSTENGEIFGTITFDAASSIDKSVVNLNGIKIDILDYIQPATCSDPAFRTMWSDFEWENKVAVNTTMTYVQACCASASPPPPFVGRARAHSHGALACTCTSSCTLCQVFACCSVQYVSMCNVLPCAVCYRVQCVAVCKALLCAIMSYRVCNIVLLYGMRNNELPCAILSYRVQVLAHEGLQVGTDGDVGSTHKPRRNTVHVCVCVSHCEYVCVSGDWIGGRAGRALHPTAHDQGRRQFLGCVRLALCHTVSQMNRMHSTRLVA